MKRFLMCGLLLGYLLMGVNQTAQAHVQYTDINSVVAIGGYDTFTNYGWQQGNAFPYATTDDVNWYSFSLSQPSLVSLSLSSTDIGNVAQPALLAPAFSLYDGQFVTNSFDTNPIYPLADGQRGLVNTAGSFSMTTQPQDGDPVANERTVNFITSASVNPGETGTAAIVNLLLAPGDYTIIASGNNAYTAAEDGNNVYGATFSFSTTAVPAPGAFWLMSSAVAGFGLFGRRKNRIA